MNEPKLIRVLFVCAGNICRSPMAEAVFRSLVQEAGLEGRIDIESAGVGGWHAGQRPDPRTLDVLRQHQIELNGKRARQLTRADLREFDYVLAMDSENVADIQAMYDKRVQRLLEYAPNHQVSFSASGLDVPDPYYIGGFAVVYDLVQAGCKGLLANIRQQEAL
jgi:protein-tyrosine phosphatase